MTAVADVATATRPRPGVVLGATVLATTVVLGLATGIGPLLGPLGDAYGVGTGAVSLVLSATVCAALGLGVVSGPMARRYGPRRLMALAALLVPAGLVVAAGTDDVVVAGAALAVGVGGGAACVVVPMTSAVAAAFGRRRGAALVVATSGGGLATVVTPPAVVAVLGEVGLRATLLACAAVSAAVLVACLPAAPGPPAAATEPGRPSPRVASLLAEPRFGRLVAATVALTAAMFVPITHLPAYTVAHGADLAAGAALVTLAGVTSLVGRLVAVPAVSRWGAWPVYRCGAALLGGALLLWAPAHESVGLGAFVVVFGFGHGAYVGLGGAVTASLHGTDGLERRLGLLYAAAAVGGLLGPAAGGLALDVTGAWSGVVAVASASGAAGVILLATIRPGTSSPSA